MDAFYASVEERDYPEYRGKPIAVGGQPEHRGVIATASYEARKWGIHSAMSSHRAMRLCPELIILPPRFEAYKAVSMKIRRIFSEYTDKIEPLSLDEAYLDVTENRSQIASATLIAKEIKAQIIAETGLTASAGVSYNKFFAKVASDFQKPNGLFVIKPNQAERFIEALAIDQFYGIGAKTSPKLKSMGIQTGRDLKALSLESLENLFGRSAQFYYGLVRGIDERPVETEWIRKSVGAERTFPQDIHDLNLMKVELIPLAEELLEWMQQRGMQGRTLTVKVKYANFQQTTRSRTLEKPFQNKANLLTLAETLLQSTEVVSRPVRLLGLSISKLEMVQDSNSDLIELPQPVQLQLSLDL